MAKPSKDLFGLRELLAIGIGGMIGGGIFSVLGLAVNTSGHAAPFAFIIAGLVALAAGYSYIKLALAFHSDGASFTYLERAFPSMPNLAGGLAWIVIVGYIGTLALYAYTFGIYAADLFGMANSMLLRGILSSVILLLFAAINLVGVKETGITEDVIVYSKIILLAILGTIGFFSVKKTAYLPIFNQGHLSVFTAAAIIFVAYEGFQLITNAVCETDKPAKNIPRSIYLSILIVSVVYFLLATMSIGNLTVKDFNLHGEYALAIAVYPTLGHVGRVLIDLSAILATTSAINATLFGSARMAAEVATKKLLPKAFSFRGRGDIPIFAIIFITLVSLIFAFMAPLKTIATFSSLTFLISSIGVTIANIKLHKTTKSRVLLVYLGLLLMLLVSGTLIWHLFVHEFNTLLLILTVYLAVTILELVFSKRKLLFARRV